MNEFSRAYPALSQPVIWGDVTLRYTPGAPAAVPGNLAKVLIVPFVGDQIVVVRMKDGHTELPGGTLEADEHYLDAAQRELMEEAGARMMGDFHPFGLFHCRTSALTPYLPHMPHPDYTRIVGWSDVEIVAAPTMPPDGEVIVAVETHPLREIIALFAREGRPDFGELCRLAAAMRG